MKKGELYIVAIPIGNLADLTFRAKEILSAVDIVACEDTRVAGGFFHHLGVKKKLISLHQHSSDEKINFIVRELELGKSCAYISDSGTPGISDPGGKLVSVVRAQGREIQTIPIPGPSALTAAISVSGMIEKEFYFAGFLPKKKGRQTKFKLLTLLDCPIVIYESAQRIEKTLNDIESYFGENTKVFLAREMTKKFEEYWDGDVNEIISDLINHKLKGEFVLVVKIDSNCPKSS